MNIQSQLKEQIYTFKDFKSKFNEAENNNRILSNENEQLRNNNHVLQRSLKVNGS